MCGGGKCVYFVYMCLCLCTCPSFLPPSPSLQNKQTNKLIYILANIVVSNEVKGANNEWPVVQKRVEGRHMKYMIKEKEKEKEKEEEEEEGNKKKKKKRKKK